MTDKIKDWWNEEEKELLKEYIIFSYIISFLLIGLILIRFVFYLESGFIYYNTYNFIIFLLFLLVIYNITNYYKIKSILTRPTKMNYILYFLYIILITVSIYNTSFNEQFIKTLYFIPVITGSIAYSQTFGFFVAGCASVNLFLLNIILNDYSHMDSDFILIILVFWVAWLIGGFINLERKIQTRLKEMAERDSLTGLANFNKFQDTFDLWLNNAKVENKPLTLVLMDLDNFKQFNDYLGHQQGNEILKAVAEQLKYFEEKDTFIARYGGDEFAIICFGQNWDKAYEKVIILKEKLDKKITIPYEEILENKLSFSIGIASYPEQTRLKRELFEMADRALYQAKSTQKDQIRIYHEVIKEIVAETEERDKELFDSLRTLLSIINVKDKYTYGHSERVAGYVEKFSEKLELNNDDKIKLSNSAYIHDIGKIEIKSSILTKKEKLNKAEWQKIKKHPEIGANILKPLKSCQYIVSVVLYHHENYDGSGYPEGLKGEEIPLCARILRIADSFDAMTTNRPYSPALTQEKALEELKKQAGLHFDPSLVKVFINLVEEGIITLK